MRHLRQGLEPFCIWLADPKHREISVDPAVARGARRRCGRRECQEFAADLAAYFSPARHEQEVEVMLTDSRHVAKRGSRVGQMKDSKRLGTMWARPARVAEVVREAQEEQGWL